MYIEVVSPSAVAPDLFAAPAVRGEPQTLTLGLHAEGYPTDEPMEGSISVSSAIVVPVVIERVCTAPADATALTITF